MGIPKLKIKYGSVLDHERRTLWKNKKFEGYPNSDSVYQKTEELRQMWAKLNDGDRVMRRITEITGIEYPEDLYAYVIGGGLTPMSKPILFPTVNLAGEPYSDSQSSETMIHEVIHNFVGDQETFPQLKPYWKSIGEQYANETPAVQHHIIVYAVLKPILIELFGEDLTQFMYLKKWPDYARAWELMEEKGSAYFIEEFRKYSSKQ